MIQRGFLQRTARGRVVTRLAFEHLGYPPPGGGSRDDGDGDQQVLF